MTTALHVHRYNTSVVYKKAARKYVMEEMRRTLFLYMKFEFVTPTDGNWSKLVRCMPLVVSPSWAEEIVGDILASSLLVPNFDDTDIGDVLKAVFTEELNEEYNFLSDMYYQMVSSSTLGVSSLADRVRLKRARAVDMYWFMAQRYFGVDQQEGLEEPFRDSYL